MRSVNSGMNLATFTVTHEMINEFRVTAEMVTGNTTVNSECHVRVAHRLGHFPAPGPGPRARRYTSSLPHARFSSEHWHRLRVRVNWRMSSNSPDPDHTRMNPSYML